MLEPLNPRMLRAIVGEEGDLDCRSICQAKTFFAENDVIQGLRNLLDAFGLWRAYLYHEHTCRELWYIRFRVIIPVHQTLAIDIGCRIPHSTASTSELTAAMLKYTFARVI